MESEHSLEDLEEVPEEVNELTRRVIGAAIAVHRALGPGFPEVVYQRSLALELAAQGIPFVQEHVVCVEYPDEVVGEGKLDFLVAERVVVELKAVEHILPVHRAQTLAYQKAVRVRVGLLINFQVL